jgi:hypothetical protein
VRLSPAERYIATRLSEEGISDGVRIALRECAQERCIVAIDVQHSALGVCVLTTDHPQSNYGQPVLVAPDGVAYGTADMPEGCLSEPLPGAWGEQERVFLGRMADADLGPLRWNINL